jgi:hypothetical protein
VLVLDPWAEWNAVSMNDPASLAEPTRSLFAVGWMRTEVNNGGFDQLFLNSGGDVLPEAESAARSAGWTDLANLLHRAMAVIGSPYPTRRADRQALLLRLGESESRTLDDLDDEFLELERTSDLDGLMQSLLDR